MARKRKGLHMKDFIGMFLSFLLTAVLFACPAPVRSESMTGNMGTLSPSAQTLPADSHAPIPSVPESGFAIEGMLGADTSLSGSTSTTTGQTIPYDFGSAPLWGIRLGKMVFSKLFLYLTLQQSDFSQNTHTIVGFGGNYLLPEILKTPLFPYLNATFGASYNTYTGTNAQAGYAWMLGAGMMYPITTVFSLFLEADLSYETAPTGITTSIGNPPGTVSRVSDTWSVPIMMGVRYAF
ncbi:MAG: hypothetical protein ACYC9S_11575 [Leptospirales bacterium]